MVLTPHAIVGNLLAALEGTPANKATMRSEQPGMFAQLVPALRMLQNTFNVDVQPQVARIRAGLARALAELDAAYPPQAS